jgi:hypothetical protein
LQFDSVVSLKFHLIFNKQLFSLPNKVFNYIYMTYDDEYIYIYPLTGHM